MVCDIILQENLNFKFFSENNAFQMYKVIS